MKLTSNTAYRMLSRLLFLLLLVPALTSAQRERVSFDFDWQFSRGSAGTWKSVQLPHDYSISLRFDERTTGCTGHLPSGPARYRKAFRVPKAWKGRRISVVFDGIFSRSTTFINGRRLGFRPYGFGYQEYDLTDNISWDADNTIEVGCDNPLSNDSTARWYTGAGIYRHVWLCAAAPVHVATYGTYVTTPEVSPEKATVRIRTTVVNASGKDEQVIVEQAIGKLKAAKAVRLVPAHGSADIEQTIAVPHPTLWDIDTPYIYNVLTTLSVGRRRTDTYTTPFGIRTVEFTPDDGFRLNGRTVKLKGFCLHQDDAAFGAAQPDRSIERRLQIIKEYGCNAIRCAHNQPSPELLDMADRMGFIVIDEALDKWKSGYYKGWFDSCWKADIGNMLTRDRNHPCVALWSIGNEVQEAWDSGNEGYERARMLQDFVHKMEPTRQVSVSCQNNHNEHFASATDVVGYNYLEQRMLADHKRHPERRCVVTEELPYYQGAEGNIRAYDTQNPWEVIAAHKFIAGGFIWSGIDYIGEAIWPSHGWPAGLFDICMVEKPRAAYHRAMWNDKPMVSIAVHDNSLDIDHGRDLWQWPPMASLWNFPKGYEGLVLEVRTTTNCDSVAMWQDGKLMGTKARNDFPNSTIVWNIPYRPGTLMAKGINGTNTVAACTLATAGDAATLEAVPDRTELKADGQDLCYIQLRLLDKAGTPVQHQSRHITAEIEGEGRLVALINSDLRRTTPFTSKEDDTYFGRAMTIVQAGRKAGTIRLKIRAEGVEDGIREIVINTGTIRN